jgi:hypothetical protein
LQGPDKKNQDNTVSIDENFTLSHFFNVLTKFPLILILKKNVNIFHCTLDTNKAYFKWYL